MPKQFILEMQENYPWGELAEVLKEDTRAIVKKSLRFSTPSEREIIRQMVHFLKAAKHPFLINLQTILEAPQQVQFYYEYAPFKLEKWIATVNEDLLGTLEEQMLELAEYLCRSSIRFAFDPECIGLSADMTVKYFLSEFSLDFEGEELHFAEHKEAIRSFFKDLTCSVHQNQTEETKECPKEEVKLYPMMESLSTNASISPLDELIELTHSTLRKNEQKKNSLSVKVEASMKKSLQALMRFKRLGSK